MNSAINILYKEIEELAGQCWAALDAIQPKGGRFANPSPATRAEYLQLAQSLLQRAGNTGPGLTKVMQDTARPSTFYKRLAVLRYHCHIQTERLMTQLQQVADEFTWRQRQTLLTQHLAQMRAVAAIQQQGLTGQRRRRSSKRQALSGLPPDWREILYLRGQGGKYALALLVSALTGCRPSELKRGVRIWKMHDDALGKNVICFQIEGSKVKAHQGQPSRLIAYDSDDMHPLIEAMNRLLETQASGALVAQIPDSVNFTVEVRRLAHCLWPRHKHAVTAYCFRHQWSADMKRLGDEDAVSRGLGHTSAKTRRHYGTASQGKPLGQLCPIRITADRPIKAQRSQLARPNNHLDDFQP